MWLSSTLNSLRPSSPRARTRRRPSPRQRPAARRLTLEAPEDRRTVLWRSGAFLGLIEKPPECPVMPTPARALALSALALALLGGAAVLARLGLGLDLGRGDLARLCRERERAAELRRRDRLMLERVAAKEAVVGQVLGRRLTLLQAAAEFRRIHERFPCADEGLPDESSEEGLCRQVLAWVRTATLTDPGRDPAVLADLEAEYADRFGHPPRYPGGG
jgi:hypothetical protein